MQTNRQAAGNEKVKGTFHDYVNTVKKVFQIKAVHL
jgi:hypothetical protein